MATRIQSTGLGSGAGTATLTFAVTPVVGRTLLLRVWQYGFTAISATDNQTPPNTYTRDVQAISGASRCAILSAPVATAAGTFTITVTGDNPVYANADEWDGVSPTPDRVNSNTGTDPNPDTGATTTTPSANGVALAVFADESGVLDTVTPNQAGSNPSSGWTQQEDRLNGAADLVGAGCWVVLSSTGAIRHVWATTTSDNFAAVVAVYPDAGGATGEIAGTLTQTLGSLTTGAVATVLGTGTLAQTLVGLALSAAATVGVVGTLTQTLASVSLVATSTGGNPVPVSGTLTQTLAELTETSAGTVRVAGVSARTLDPLGVSVAGTVAVVGTVSRTLDPVTLSAGARARDPNVPSARRLGFWRQPIGPTHVQVM